jgi:hypothetical protein
MGPQPDHTFVVILQSKEVNLTDFGGVCACAHTI